MFPSVINAEENSSREIMKTAATKNGFEIPIDTVARLCILFLSQYLIDLFWNFRGPGVDLYSDNHPDWTLIRLLKYKFRF